MSKQEIRAREIVAHGFPCVDAWTIPFEKRSEGLFLKENEILVGNWFNIISLVQNEDGLRIIGV